MGAPAVLVNRLLCLVVQSHRVGLAEAKGEIFALFNNEIRTGFNHRTGGENKGVVTDAVFVVLHNPVADVDRGVGGVVKLHPVVAGAARFDFVDDDAIAIARGRCERRRHEQRACSQHGSRKEGWNTAE